MAQSTEGLHKSRTTFGSKAKSLFLLSYLKPCPTPVNKGRYEYNIWIHPQSARPLCMKLLKPLNCLQSYFFFRFEKKKNHPARLNTFITSGLKVNYHPKKETSDLGAAPAIAASSSPSFVGWLYRSKEASHGKTQSHLASGWFLSTALFTV